MMRPIVSALLIATIAIVCGKAASAQTPADIVLLNGKVITVDDRFTIAEALAIKGERILAGRQQRGGRETQRAAHARGGPESSHCHPWADR